MRKKVFRILVIFTCLIVACNMKWYKFTSKLENKNLYVEFFVVNYFGVDAEYLTDSISFRKYIGKIDEEHEAIQYQCLGDSIFVTKLQWGNRDTTIALPDGTKMSSSPSDTVKKMSFSLSQLKRQHKFE